MSDRDHDYRIDYEAPDVVDLMRQIRTRATEGADGEPGVALAPAEARMRLRDYLDLDEARPYTIQEELGLGGDWNVTPEDLRASGTGASGALVGACRRLLRPFAKLIANLELPLYKQFKVNLGAAAAIRDLLTENDTLRRRIGDLERRVHRLEAAAGPDDTDAR